MHLFSHPRWSSSIRFALTAAHLFFATQFTTNAAVDEAIIGQQIAVVSHAFEQAAVTDFARLHVRPYKKPELDFPIFAGSASIELTHGICRALEMSPSPLKIETFNDGEKHTQYQINIRKQNIYIVQSTCKSVSNDETFSVNDNLMELYLSVKTAKRASVHEVTAVIPYFGYARQDRKTKPRVPISASDVAGLLEISGIARVVTVDLHCAQIQGFFRDVPVDNLPASHIFAKRIREMALDNIVVVSPDAGGAERAEIFRSKLALMGIESTFAMIAKKRAGAGVVESMTLIGDIAGKNAIIIDDMCDTGGTLVKAGDLLLENGATSIYACFTHPVFSKDALSKLGASRFTRILTTDTIPLRAEKPENIDVLSVAPLIAGAVFCSETGASLSDFLNNYGMTADATSFWCHETDC